MLQGGGALTSSFGILSSAILTFSLIFISAFALAFIVGGNLAPVTDSSAAEISVVNEATGYYANITSSGTVNLSIASTPDGAYKVGKDTLSIDTNAKNGYKLYISTIDHSSDSPALPSGTPANGLINGSSSSTYLSPSTGTINTPVRLETNTWGYTTSRSTSSQAPTTYTDSDANPTTGAEVWRGVPTYTNEDMFYANTNPQNTGSPAVSTNSVDVYYAANASTALPSGTYTNTVLYTAIVDGGVDESGITEASISPISQEGLAQGQQVTISTSLYPGFNLDNLGNITVKIGDNDCTNITPSLTSIGSLNLTCTAPAQATAGKYTVTATISKYNKTYTLDSAYEYIPALTISNSNTTATFTSGSTTAYIPLGSSTTLTVTPNSGYYLSSVSCSTGYICTGYNTGSSYTGTQTITITNDSATSDSSIGLGGELAETRTITDISSMQDINAQICTNTTAGVSKSLTDSRDSISYTIKKMADGKCWMVNNLRFSGTGTLSSSTSNVPSNNTFALGSSTTDFSTSCTDASQWMDAGSTTYGNFYNWYAATAGQGTCSMTSGSVSYDICPAGWRLPTLAEFNTLYISTGSSASNMLSTAAGDNYWGAVLAGSRNGSSTWQQGTYGYYWSSTARNASSAYALRPSSSSVNPQFSMVKYYGFSVRCVAK